MAAYYTMLVKLNGVWGPDFGDYDKEVVADEAADRKDVGEVVKVVRCKDDTLAALQAAMDKAGLAYDPRLFAAGKA